MSINNELYSKLDELISLKSAGVTDSYQFSINVKDFGRQLYLSNLHLKEKMAIVDKFNECYKDTKLKKLFVSFSLDLWRTEYSLPTDYDKINIADKKVSIQVPVYNKEKFGLSRALDSLINQTHKNLEIICVNDASTDNSLQVLEDYAKKDSRIKIINFETNRKVLAGRVASFEFATGDYITAVDPDDWVDENYIKEMLEHIVALDIDVVRCSRFTSPIVDELMFYGAVYEIPFISEHWNSGQMNVSICGKIYKASVIKSALQDMKKLKSFNLGDDGVLMLYILKQASTIGSAKINSLYHYDLNVSSITNSKNLLSQSQDVIYICEVLSLEFDNLQAHKQICNLFKVFVMPYLSAEDVEISHKKSLISSMSKDLLSMVLMFSML